MSAAAILALLQQALPFITTGIPELIAWIETLRTAAKQTAEWTDAQDQAFVQALYTTTQDPRYAPDPGTPEPPAAA